MRIINTKNFPKRAGKAILEYKVDESEPKRDEEYIILPLIPRADLFFLAGGNQFLFHIGKERNDHWDRYWFGGTDENPFLVEITSKPLNSY